MWGGRGCLVRLGLSEGDRDGQSVDDTRRDRHEAHVVFPPRAISMVNDLASYPNRQPRDNISIVRARKWSDKCQIFSLAMSIASDLAVRRLTVFARRNLPGYPPLSRRPLPGVGGSAARDEISWRGSAAAAQGCPIIAVDHPCSCGSR